MPLSDVGLAQICKKHCIPRPSVGYWAKREFGSAPEPVPLPKCDDPQLQTIVLHKAAPTISHTTPEENREHPYDAEVKDLLRRAMGLSQVAVSSELRGLHPLVKETLQYLQKARPDEHSLMWGGPLKIRVSKASVRRAMLFMDALIKTIEGLGGTVTEEKERWQSETVVTFLGEKAGTIRLRERYNQKPRPPGNKEGYHWHKYLYIPNGMLELDSGPDYFNTCYCRDTERGKRIENAINRVVIGFIERVGKDRIKSSPKGRSCSHP